MRPRVLAALTSDPAAATEIAERTGLPGEARRASAGATGDRWGCCTRVSSQVRCRTL
ncbi:MAG: hypothetical protein K2X54_16180 [Methylobacterium organophilum]|nr:hypothetical protein [Methylobacterium organophilum]